LDEALIREFNATKLKLKDLGFATLEDLGGFIMENILNAWT